VEPWRACRLVVADSHYFNEEQDSHHSDKSDPDPHQSEKSDPDQNQKRVIRSQIRIELMQILNSRYKN
jgi:hypothetical protein